MKPAFSLVFFTVVSGAGLGLIALIALFDLFGPGSLPPPAVWRGTLLGLALVATGLAASLLHLAKPRNAWRALAGVRTSWLSREAAFAMLLFPVAGVYAALAAQGTQWLGRTAFAVASAVVAWAVLASTAMIYASLRPIRQWHTPWTPASYALLGHWSGALFLAATANAYGNAPASLVEVAAGLGLAGLASKLGYWYTIGRAAPTTLTHAIGVDQGLRAGSASTRGQARLLDVGHAESTFLTREFAFALARRHADALRIVALVLGFGLPLGFLVWGLARWPIALAVALCCMIGLVSERWLFFAEARHTVRLYRGELSA